MPFLPGSPKTIFFLTMLLPGEIPGQFDKACPVCHTTYLLVFIDVRYWKSTRKALPSSNTLRQIPNVVWFLNVNHYTFRENVILPGSEAGC